MGIKQLYNDNLRKLPNEYGDVSVMHQNKRQAKFCFLVLRCCFSGMSNFLHTLRLTRLKMSEIILTGCKTQIIIIIITMTAQLKVHINTTTVAKYDNDKYDKPEKL